MKTDFGWWGASFEAECDGDNELLTQLYETIDDEYKGHEYAWELDNEDGVLSLSVITQ